MPVARMFSYGMSILSPDKDEIWAFFARNGNTPDGLIQFRTTSALLNSSPFAPECDPDMPDVPPHRNTYVRYDQDLGTWVAGGWTMQKDFEENDMFIRAKFTGPETVYEALNILMNDTHFRRYFASSRIRGESLIQNLEAYRNIVKQRRVG